MDNISKENLIVHTYNCTTKNRKLEGYGKTNEDANKNLIHSIESELTIAKESLKMRDIRYAEIVNDLATLRPLVEELTSILEKLKQEEAKNE